VLRVRLHKASKAFKYWAAPSAGGPILTAPAAPLQRLRRGGWCGRALNLGYLGTRLWKRQRRRVLDFASDSADVLAFGSDSADVLAFGSDTSL